MCTDWTAEKKKKKKSKVDELEKELAGEEGDEEKPKAVEPEAQGDPIAGTGVYEHGSTTDIPYPMLLNRFFTLLSDRHPDLVPINLLPIIWRFRGSVNA
jgi:translation initiation factor 2 subunit 2